MLLPYGYSQDPDNAGDLDSIIHSVKKNEETASTSEKSPSTPPQEKNKTSEIITPPSSEKDIEELLPESLKDDQKSNIKNGVILQGIDKITGRFFTIKAKIGQPIEFGALKIKVHYCHATPPEQELPESTAFVEIWEHKFDEKPVLVFSNWMFASTPGTSTLEHPIYSVWVKACVNL